MRYFDFHNAYFPHAIMLESFNEEKLLQLKKLATLKVEVSSWLDNNIGVDNWVHNHGILSFKTKEDAMAFMLRWS